MERANLISRRALLAGAASSTAMAYAGPQDSAPDELTALTLTDAAARIHDKRVSSTELTNACLKRIETLDSRLNSFITVTPGSALD